MFGLGTSELQILAVVALVIYVLPTITAFRRRHEKAWAVALVNIALGWTLIIWVAAFIWAHTGQNAPIPGTTADCPFCKGKIPADAQKCQHCGEWVNQAETIPAPTERPCVECGTRK